MNPTQIGRLAVLGLAVALAVPAMASSANEVTKWNEIAITTVNAQPAATSAPPAASIFVAMVQGAVYGAVNATDRHGRPYLVMHSYPKASPEAAAATAAFRVLNTLFPSTSLQTAYDASLAGIPNGAAKTTGIQVGTMAADATAVRAQPGRAGCTEMEDLAAVQRRRGAAACATRLRIAAVRGRGA